MSVESLLKRANILDSIQQQAEEEVNGIKKTVHNAAMAGDFASAVLIENLNARHQKYWGKRAERAKNLKTKVFNRIAEIIRTREVF